MATEVGYSGNDTYLATGLKTLVSGEQPTAGDAPGRLAIISKNNSTYISTATTTVVKASAGYLDKIIITETAAGAITIYNNTSAAGEVVAVFKASIVENSYPIGRYCDTGITIVTAGTSKVTAVWL